MGQEVSLHRVIRVIKQAQREPYYYHCFEPYIRLSSSDCEYLRKKYNVKIIDLPGHLEMLYSCGSGEIYLSLVTTYPESTELVVGTVRIWAYNF